MMIPSLNIIMFWGSDNKDLSSVVIDCSEWLNHFRVHNIAVLHDAVENRPKGQPLITIANHHSCLDEPVLWGRLLVVNKVLVKNIYCTLFPVCASQLITTIKYILCTLTDKTNGCKLKRLRLLQDFSLNCKSSDFKINCNYDCGDQDMLSSLKLRHVYLGL